MYIFVKYGGDQRNFEKIMICS